VGRSSERDSLTCKRRTHHDSKKSDGDVTGEEVEEGSMEVFVLAARVNTEHEDRLWDGLSGVDHDRDHDGVSRRVFPSPRFERLCERIERDQHGLAAQTRLLERPRPVWWRAVVGHGSSGRS